MKSWLVVILSVWFVAVFALGARGAFVQPPSDPPLGILLGFLGPLLVFAVAYGGSSSFRRFVLSADVGLLTAIQAWRTGGLAFLALSAQGLLPGVFAWPAGLGDIAIGVTAPWVALSVFRNRSVASSRWFAVWNLLGVLDLFVAVGIGALSSGFLPSLASSITTAPMAQLPLVLIPAYLVPLFLMMHFVALTQGRKCEVGRSGEQAAVQAATSLSGAIRT